MRDYGTNPSDLEQGGHGGRPYQPAQRGRGRPPCLPPAIRTGCLQDPDAHHRSAHVDQAPDAARSGCSKRHPYKGFRQIRPHPAVRVPLHLTVPVFSDLFDGLDLGWGKVEQRVDPGVELSFQPHDLGGVLAMFGPTVGQPDFPVVALPYWDIPLKDLLDLGPKRREIQLPPGSELLVQPPARHAEIGLDPVARPPVSEGPPGAERPRCAAKTRRGTPFQTPASWPKGSPQPGNGRCRMHGGLSTSPKTLEGKAAIAASNRRRHNPSPERSELPTTLALRPGHVRQPPALRRSLVYASR